MAKNVAMIARLGFIGAAFVIAPACLLAQAPPGPMGPPQNQSQTDTNQSAQPASPPKPQVAPRTTLAGTWQFNADQSDDPRHKVRAADDSGGATPRPVGGGYPGGYPGGGYPYPGGYPGGGYPYPGGGVPEISGRDLADNPKLQPLINPSHDLTIDLKSSAAVGAQNNVPAEVDITDEDFNQLVLYTDGRQLPKQQTNTNNRDEISAHWNGTQLASDEKSPLGGKLTRTYELSKDGRQLYETIHIDHGKKTPIVIRYVYDATSTAVEPGDADPNRPVLKRRADDASDSSQLR